MITALDRGLKALAAADDGHNHQHQQPRRSSERLGEGELRRRRDLMANARKEKDALEALANASAGRAGESSMSGPSNGSLVATAQQKTALFGTGGDARHGGSQHGHGQGQGQGQGRGRRVLGGAPAPETEQTRELDNRGVVQLLKQQMEEQDQSVEDLTKVVMRLKELGIAFNDELELQNAMLKIVNEDVTRWVLLFSFPVLLYLFSLFSVVLPPSLSFLYQKGSKEGDGLHLCLFSLEIKQTGLVANALLCIDEQG